MNKEQMTLAMLEMMDQDPSSLTDEQILYALKILYRVDLTRLLEVQFHNQKDVAIDIWQQIANLQFNINNILYEHNQEKVLSNLTVD